MKKLNSERTPHTGSSSFSRATRLLSFLLVLVSLLQMLPMTAWAAWDGSGDISGDMGSVSGTTKLFRDNEHNIVGYRFSVYDADGNKKGHSVDIDIGCTYYYFTDNDAYRYWYPVTDEEGNVEYYDKKSHIDLNREYQAYYNDGAYDGDQPTLGKPVLLPVGVEDESKLIYLDTGLLDTDGYTIDPATISVNDDPTTEEDESADHWLNADKASIISELYCGAGEFDADTNYMIVEPLYFLMLNGEHYVMTSAEYAL